MTDRDRWELRGPVRSCQLQRTWYARRCGPADCETEERGDTTVVEFRPDGALTRRVHQNPDGSEWTATYEYDDAARLLNVRSEGPTGVLVQTREYDADGRLTRLLERDASGSDRVVEQHEYDALGRRKTTRYVHIADRGSSVSLGFPVADIESQTVELSYKDSTGRELGRVEFEYDEAGVLIAETLTHAVERFQTELLADAPPDMAETLRALSRATCRHRYDDRQRRIETRLTFGPLSVEQRTVAYNDHGDKIEEISEDENRDYNFDDRGRLSDTPVAERASRSEARFEYECDARGNWTKKVVAGPERRRRAVHCVQHRAAHAGVRVKKLERAGERQ
jgi:hypothetical protein